MAEDRYEEAIYFACMPKLFMFNRKKFVNALIRLQFQKIFQKLSDFWFYFL